MSIVKTLKEYAQNNLNVLLIGAHGIGKTAVVEQVCNDLSLKIKYYSASTLDPWADLVGVPVPIHETESLNFYRPTALENAEIVMFDELNRAHPRVLNAVLELVQKKAINGKSLPNLKMVWAAINPPGGDYDVEDLDPALVDRFQIYIHMKAEFNMEYMKTVMSEDVAKILRTWWHEDMDPHQRKLITPRRLEYLGILIDKDLEWKNALPAASLPDGDLRRRVRQLKLGEKAELEITKANILADPKAFIDKIIENPATGFKVQEVISRFAPHDMFAARDVLEALPKDLVRSIGHPKWNKAKRDLFNLFLNDRIDLNLYPKIYAGFGLEEWDK